MHQEDKTMPVAISTARFEARISTDLHSLTKRAAELQVRTMTDFMVSAVQDAAQPGYWLDGSGAQPRYPMQFAVASV
jgi:hypothetical protein